MKKINYIVLSFLTIFLISCQTNKRPYPSAYYQCEKCGEAFEISKPIDENNLSCPDKSCEGTVEKVASYRRDGSGLNTRYGYSDPWEVGYSGPYVGSRGFLGVGFHGGGHHHYYHDDRHSKSGSKKSNRPPARRIVNSDKSNSNSVPMKRIHSGSNSSNTPSSSSRSPSRSIPSKSSNGGSSNSSRSPSRSIPSKSSSSSSKGSSGRRINN